MASLTQKYPSIVRKLLVPPMAELCDLLNDKMSSNFAEVKVEVVDCPDLRKEPFHMAGEGLNGKPMIADIGGVPYLMPLPRFDKQPYSFTEIAQLMGFQKGLILGAACSPFHVTGLNCEMMPNIHFEVTSNGEVSVNNATYCAKVVRNDEYELFKLNSTECFLFGNVFVCESKPGKVLKISARKRIGELNFTECIRNALRSKYGNQCVSLGGVFLLKNGNAKLHINPDFSKVPLNTQEERENWLKYFDMNSPLICLSVLHSFDDNLGLRIEHTHCFSTHGQGGHYHYDTTPDHVEYEAYFNV
ncbi:hypothetical protein B4U80_03684, partial [Leptotrombidium deliense]